MCICFLASCATHTEKRPLQTGTQELIAGKLYVVHSLSLINGKPNTTSNIFLLRGMGDTVWIFGCGYGNGGPDCDAQCSDYAYYKGPGYHTAHNAIDDVRSVDSVITGAFHVMRDSAMIECIVPHFHADHINSEFFYALFDSLHYPQKAGEKIYVHVNDFEGSTCNSPCCGHTPCGDDKQTADYAVPYDPPWSPALLAMFVPLGEAADPCGQVVMRFRSACGTWNVCKGMAVRDGGHTDGTVNLENTDMHLRIAGTQNNPQCPLPEGWKTITVHGNTDL